MKKIFILLFVFICFFAGGVYAYALPNLEKSIISKLSKLGFKNIEIENLSISLNGADITKMYLNNDKVSFAQNVRINFFWPTYFFNKKIKDINISSLELYSITDSYQSLLKARHNALKYFKNAPLLTKITIDEISWNTQLPNGDIRIKGNLKQKNESNAALLELNAEQYELAFSSNWVVKFDNKNGFSLSGEIKNFKTNLGPLNINRGFGWLSFSKKGDDEDISGQIDAGSGKIYQIPLNNISLTLNKNKEYYPLLFRSNAAGIEGTRLSIDAHLSKNLEHQKLETNLKIENLSSFLSSLSNQKIIVQYNKQGDLKDTNVTFNYMPEKRFADGPFPFKVLALKNNVENTNGTLLIYPTTFDMRGTLTSNQQTLKVLQHLFPTITDKIVDNTIRIDSNLKKLISN